MLSALLTLLCPVFLWAYDPPPLTGPVVDQANILSASEKSQIENQLRSLYSRTGVQGQVFIISSLGGDSIEQVSIDTVEKWQLGSKEKDDGLLFLVAPSDRKARIEVGQGLEGDLPDVLAFQIIQQKMLPEFKRGNFAQGISSAIATAESIINPESSGAATEAMRERSSGPAPISFFKIILFVLAFILMSSTRFGRGMLLGMLLSGGGRSRGGGFGGGGGWSGGGGGFSGGGASGGW